MAIPSALETLPATTDDRHALLLRLIDQWYDDTSARHANSRFPTQTPYDGPVPEFLHRWWTSCGDRSEVWSRQDRFLSQNELFVVDDRLVFYVENQGVVHWGIELALVASADPPIQMTIADGADTWQPLDNSLSAFALHSFAYNLNFHPSKPYLYGFADSTAISYAQENYPALDFPSNWWPGGRLHGFGDIIIHLDDADFLHVTSLLPSALAPFRTLASNGAFDINAESDGG